MSNQDGSVREGEATASKRIAGGSVSIRKTPEKREDGFVVTYTLRSSTTEPVAVTFDDEFDVTDPENIGFHRDHAPVSWRGEAESVSIEHTLNPDEQSRLMLGIVTGDRSAPTAAVMADPEITSVETIDEEAAADTSADASNGRSDPSLYERAKKSLMAGESESGAHENGKSERERGDNEMEFEENDEDGELELDLGKADENGEQTSTSDIEESETEIESFDSADETDSADASDAVDPIELSDEGRDASPSSGETNGTADSDASEGESLELEIDELNDGSADDSASPRESEATEESVVSALVSELEAENVPEEELEVLREHLAVGTSRSEEVRLDHVQSRLDDLAAYVTMFEQFIDERGTFREFANETDDTIESLQSDLEEMRQATDEIRTDQETMERGLGSIQDRLDSLQSRLEEQSDAFTEDLAAVEDRQGSIENDVDRIETDLESELAEIRTHIDRFEQLPEALESVFQTGDGDALEGL